MPLSHPDFLRYTSEGSILDPDQLFCLGHFDGMSRRLLQYYASVSRDRRMRVALSFFLPDAREEDRVWVQETSELPPAVTAFLDQLDDASVAVLQEDYSNPKFRFLSDIGWQYGYLHSGGETRVICTNTARVNDLPAGAHPFERLFLECCDALHAWSVAVYEARIAALTGRAEDPS